MIEELYDTCFQELMGWCRAMTKDREQAQDLVQEAFLRALYNVPVLEGLKPQQQRAWMYRTVKNLYVDRIRHASHETVVEAVPERTAEPEEITNMDYEQLLNLLPDEEKLLFTMRYLEGYNSSELGKLFCLPPATVRARLASARKHLKELLTQ